MNSKRTIPSFFDYLFFIFFLTVWIIPLGYYGIYNRPFPRMPRALSFLHNASALFINSVPSWPQYFIQLQFVENGPWITYDYSGDFKMNPFGYRTRLNRFFEIFSQGDYAKLGREEFANWIRDCFAKKNPGLPQPIAVRFLHARTLVKKTGFSGHWENRPLSDFADKDRFMISEHRFKTESAQPSSNDQ